jgi:excisionase family DNA binding protein
MPLDDRDDTRAATYTISEVCGLARVGRSYVYGEVRAGRLLARKLGRSTRILARDLDAWLSAAPVIAPSAAPDAARRPRRR